MVSMSAKKNLLRKLLEVGQRFRFNVTPNHFYSDIPDLRTMKSETWWRRVLSMDHVLGADIQSQLSYLQRICEPYLEDMRTKRVHDRACEDNGEAGYGQIEADVLYCYIRKNKPRRIVQVGCGVSTSIILNAATDEQYAPEVICIEPYPTAFLKRLASEKKITLLAERMQTAARAPFESLAEGDLLFVDSTHTLKPGSEVTYVMCEIIPCLALGVGIHFHDIYLPYDYIPSILQNQIFFWHETVLLYALLVNNSRLRIDVGMAMIHHAAAERAKELLPNYNPRPMENGLAQSTSGHFPSSVYLTTCDL